MAVQIMECQNQMNDSGPLRKEWPSEYQYLGPWNGYYAFVNPDTGKAELFARRKTAPSGWHLIRGAYFYEFCSSMPND
jgi:hypothetical protein